MHRNTLFWGTVFILAGLVFLLNNLGILAFDVWGIIWPLFLVLLGLWILFGSLQGRRTDALEHTRIPLDGATWAHLDINHGAGRLRISSGAAAGDLLEGDFHGGLEVRTDRKGDLLHAKLSVPVRFFPFGPWDWGRYGLDWSLVINREIPYSLGIHTGAVESTLDLGDLLVNELRLQTGASSTSIVLPMNAGHTQAVLEAGAASIRIKVPSGVAARIFNRSGLSSVNIDTTRFPRRGDRYESPDYGTAMNKVELEIRTGVGSVDIR